jgi:ABC-type nitrate/sulfonate/bicarbonate transport system permease component
MFGTFHCNIQGMGSPSYGSEESISSQRALLGNLYGVATGIYVGFIFGLSTEEVSLWPQVGSEGMVCQYGLLPIITELCML